MQEFVECYQVERMFLLKNNNIIMVVFSKSSDKMLPNQHLFNVNFCTIIFHNLIIDGYGNFLYYRVMKNLSNNDEEIDREKNMFII